MSSTFEIRENHLQSEDGAKPSQEAAPKAEEEAATEAQIAAPQEQTWMDEAPGRSVGPWAVKAVAQVLAQLSQVPGGSWRTTSFDSARAPGVSVEAYAARLHEQMCCSPECFIFAFIYLDRYLEADNGRLSVTNVHRLLLTSLRISTKVFDDQYRSMKSCAAIGGVKTKELVSLEACFLRRINWRVYVAPEECEECATALASLDIDQLAKAVRRRPGIAASNDAPMFAPVARLLQRRQAPATDRGESDKYDSESKLMGSRKFKTSCSHGQTSRRVLQRRKVKDCSNKAASMLSTATKMAQKKLVLLRSVNAARHAAGEALLRRNVGDYWRRTFALSLATASRGMFHTAARLAAR